MQAYAARKRAIGGARMDGGQQIGFLRTAIGLAARYVEQRTVGALPWMNWGVGGDGMYGAGDSALSMQVPHPEYALRLGAVYAATSLLADLVAALPLHSFREVGGTMVPMGSMPALFQTPSVQGTMFDWLHRLMTSLALWGNAYGLITSRDGYGYPTGVEWLNPLNVSVEEAQLHGPGSFVMPIFRWYGAIVPKEQLIHIPWYTLPHRVKGLSPIGAYSTVIRTGLGAQRYSADWFDDGGVPPGTFKNVNKTVNRDESEEVKSRLVSAIRSHQPIVYGSDWEYNPIAIPPNEAKFIETVKLTATMIAAIYRIPPEMIGGETGRSMTYQNVEQQMTNLVMLTLLPWVTKIEAAFYKLLPEKQYVKFNVDAMIRADIATRHTVYKTDREIGLKSINEIRDLEELPRIPGGDSYEPLAVNAQPTVDGKPAPSDKGGTGTAAASGAPDSGDAAAGDTTPDESPNGKPKVKPKVVAKAKR